MNFQVLLYVYGQKWAYLSILDLNLSIFHFNSLLLFIGLTGKITENKYELQQDFILD